MRIRLIDDPLAKMPNLALMKLSAWHKAQGDSVSFKEPRPDRIYASCIFPKSRSDILGQLSLFPSAEIRIGGYGINKAKLPPEIEHICPDYSLYDIDYSMGFTSRGCPRQCPWCIIPKIEGPIHDLASLSEFLRHSRLILLDNNFLASPRCYENLRSLINQRIRVNFSQGLDIRLVDSEIVHLLSRVRYATRTFSRRILHFSFDEPDLEPSVLEGIRKLKAIGIKPRHLVFYVLVGFNTEFHEDLSRVKLLVREGVLPYVMRYNYNRKDHRLNAFARWANNPWLRDIPWEKYTRRSH